MHTYYLKGSSIYASFSNVDVKLRFKCAFLVLLTNNKVPFLAKAILYPINYNNQRQITRIVSRKSYSHRIAHMINENIPFYQ